MRFSGELARRFVFLSLTALAASTAFFSGECGQRLAYGFQRPRGQPFQKPYRLFDLSQDISEQVNLMGQRPDLAKQLEKARLEIRDRETSR